MRITSKGPVTIPIGIRKEAGLLPGTEVEVLYDNGAVRIVAAGGRGARLIEHLRSHPGDIRITTDEIMCLTRGE